MTTAPKHHIEECDPSLFGSFDETSESCIQCKKDFADCARACKALKAENSSSFSSMGLGYVVEVTGKMVSTHNQKSRDFVLPIEVGRAPSSSAAMALALGMVPAKLYVEKVEVICSFLS